MSIAVDAELIASRLTSNLAATWTNDEMGDQAVWHHARRVLLEGLLGVDEAGLDVLIVQARRDIDDLVARIDRILAARTSR